MGFGLETRVYRLLNFAELTLDLAAPVKRAGASLDDCHLLRFVASAAAHQVAAVDTDTRVVALSTVGAENAEFRVLLAERGRGFQVDEVLRSGRLVLRVVRLQLEVVPVSTTQTFSMPVHRIARRIAHDRVPIATHPIRVAHHNSGRAVESILQIVPDHAKIG